MPAEALTIRTVDDMERTGAWALARRSLGVTAFGLNVVDIAPGDAIPEHDEVDRDQEEVFLTLSGIADARGGRRRTIRCRRGRSRGWTRSRGAPCATTARSPRAS